MGEAVLRRLGSPSLVGSANAVGEEMGLGAEELVEVEGDGDVALRSERGRRSESGGGGVVVVVGGGGVAEELEVGEEAVGPFAGGGECGLEALGFSRGGESWREEGDTQVGQGLHLLTWNLEECASA